MRMTKTIKRVLISLCCAVFGLMMGLIVTINAPFTAKAADITTTTDMYCHSAGIRLHEDGKNGIRFRVRTDADKDGNVTLDGVPYSAEEFKALTTGILLIPSNKLSSTEELTIEGATNRYESGAKAANVTGEECVWFLKNEGDEWYYEATAYIYNITESNYEKDFTFRGYYSADGENYVYTGTQECSVAYVALTAKQGGYNGAYAAKLEEYLPQRVAVNSNFTRTSNYLYRVGNQNEVKFSSLFTAKKVLDSDKEADLDLDVKAEKVKGDATVTYANDNFSFEGTGIVKITVTEAYSRNAAELLLEVIDATNITKITDADNATDKDVVLLNDVGASSLNIANGHTFYGNGFKVSFGGNGSYRDAAVSYGFVTITKGGVLDNAQIICNIFPQSYLYTKEMTLTDENNRVPYGYSAVIISDNSTISNCYIYGARNNIQVGEGNVTIENTVTECGSLANIHIRNSNSSYTVTLKDLTTIQYVTTSSFDTSAKVLGFGVLVGLSENESNPTIKLEGYLKQYNWVTDEHTSNSNVSSSYARTAIGNALKETNYQHTANGATTINMGIVYLNEKTATINDSRTDKATAPYLLKTISMATYKGQVYSLTNGGNTSKAPVYGATYNETYVPNAQRDTRLSFVYDGANGAVVVGSVYENGAWNNTLKLDLDKINGGSYNVYFNSLKVQKYGSDLTYTVKDESGNTVDKNAAITFNALATKHYTLVVTDNLIYNANGELTGESKTMEVPFEIHATKTSIAPPKFTNAGGATAVFLVKSKGGDFYPAYQALNGVSVTYWSASQSKVVTVDLTSIYDKGSISNNVWTYTCDDYTLTITGGAIHSDGTTVYPVVANGALYFVSAKNFGNKEANYKRTIVLTYNFEDKNASNGWSRSETVNYAGLTEYDHDSFVNNGKLQEASSGGSPTCLAEGTLITLADGSKERIENLRKGNMVMAFDHLTGQLTANKVIIVVRTASEFYKNTFVFDDGTELVTINEHGIFDLDLNKYVNIDHENYTEYLGHNFVSIDANGNIGTKKLVNVVSVFESGYKYDIVTEQTLNYVAEDTLSVTHVLVDIINTFDFGESLTYDQKRMQEDIEKYGLYTYDEWTEYCDISVFEEYNIPIMKIGVAKGLYTKEYIIYLINTYVLDDSVQIID